MSGYVWLGLGDMSFVNQVAFDDRASRQLALGTDLNPRTAMVDAQGNILLYAQTGGMLTPQREELHSGTTLYRFASGSGDALGAMSGGWWLEQRAFERIERFGQVHDITVPMAARILCGVPPEWQDMGLLVRVRLMEELLAWRGLANTVVTPHRDGGPKVVMLHQNALAERQLHQLYIPGLTTKQPNGRFADSGLAKRAFNFESEWRFTKAEAMRGWLYV